MLRTFGLSREPGRPPRLPHFRLFNLRRWPLRLRVAEARAGLNQHAH